MLFKIISYLPSIVGLSAIGLLTYLKDSKSRMNLYFFLLVLTIALWLFTLFVGDLTISHTVSLWSIRGAAAIGSLIIPLMLYFSVYFPVLLRKPHWYFHGLALIPAVIFFLLSLSPFLIPDVKIQPLSAQPVQLGTLYTLQSAYAIIGFGASFLILLKKFRHLGPRERAQIRLLSLGLMVAVAVNIITGFVLAVSGQANNYSNLTGGLSFLAFAGMTSYAIVKHRLFDIRLAITRTVGFLATISLVATLYSVLIIGIGAPLVTHGRITLVKNSLQLLLLLPPTIFIALTFHSIQQFITRATRRIFYQDSYDSQNILDKLSDTLITESDIQKIMSGSLAVLSGAIKPSNAFFAVPNAQGGYRHVSINKSDTPEIKTILEESKNFKDNLVVKDELPPGGEQQRLSKDDISLLLRLGDMKAPTAVIIFGPKQNGRIYTQQDINLLRTGYKNLGIALDNAKKYEQIAQFAETLREEVRRATADLRKANEELKTLDSLKDDFISMASHQLRTPANSVHEAIQMLDEGSLTPAERKRLVGLAEASSERLVNVVVNMLSIARIQTGRFTVDKSKVNMQELVERALVEMTVFAEQKQIKLNVSKPRAPINLLADRAKINEAISNYIENAIKYSEPRGTIAISLKENDGRISFEVADSGIGVPQNERKNLFTKFYRAKNARLEQPDGNGIGLFVVKTIAQAHGGDAYYKPLEKGSLFGLWIPSQG